MMVGILLSYWGGLFSGAMLVSGRVSRYLFGFCCYLKCEITINIWPPKIPTFRWVFRLPLLKERPEIGPRNDPALREMLVLVEMKHPRVKVGESEMTPKSNESEESARKLLQTFLHHVYGVSASRSATLSYVFWLDMGVGWGGVGDDDVPCTTSHLRKMLGWGGGDVNVPDTCTHVGCYARCWVGVGGMLTFLTLAHMLDATQDAGLGWGGW